MTPVLRLASGEEIPLDPVTIASNASVSVWVNEGLLKHSPSLLSQPGSYGSVLFRFTSFHARNLQAAVALSLRGGPISFHLSAYPPADFAEWPRATGAGSQEGIWWHSRSGGTDTLVVTNSSDKLLAATLWLSDAKGQRWRQDLKLAAHQTQRLDLRELVSVSGLGGSYGGIKVEVPSYAGALHGVHFAYDEAAKTAAFLKMFSRDPQAKLQERIAATDSRPWTMWAPMLPLQMPDPAIGLPAGTVLQPTIFVRNTTAKPAAASINLSWRSAAAKGVAKLKDMNLAAFETSQIPIGALQKQLGIPDDAHWALVTLSTAGMPDDLMADAASYDSTGRYGLEAPFSDNLGNWFMGGEWRVDANHNQLMVVTNSGQKPTDALLTLHYDEGGKSKSYEMRQTIQPGEQMWVNLAELIRNRLADRRGNLLPADLVNGTYDLRDLGPRPGALTISSVMPDSVRGNPAGAPLATCCGVYSAAFFPDLISVLDMGLPFDFTAQGTNECTHSPEDLFTDVISWWSGNPAIAKVTPGKVQGSATGTTTANGETDPIYVGMGTNCILKYFYPIAQVTVAPQILRNGTNIAGTTQSAVVGQQIALTSSYTLPSGVTVSSRSWSVSGTTVGGFSTGTNGGPVATTFTLDSTTFYWVAAGNSLSVKFTLNLSNGQSPSASATFNVVGPTAPNVATSTGQVIVTTSPPLVLRFGASNANPGIRFTASATPPSGYFNTFVWVQLLDNYSISLQGNPNHLCSWTDVLDTVYPYPPLTSTTTADNPNLGLSSIYTEESFGFAGHMFLMWSSGLSGSIPVPLGSLTWQVSADAVQDMNTQQWSLKAGSQGSANQFQTGDSYPSWIGIVGNQCP